MSVATLPPPPHHPSRPQLPPPLLHAQANPPFVNPNCFPNLHYFFPPYQIPFQQPCYWPSQFGQYIPHHTSTQPSLLPQNLNPPKLPPSSTDTSHSSQTKPSPSHGEQGKSAFFRIDTKAFFLAFDEGCTDSYSITEKQGRYHGSIRVGRSGLDWIIACLVELSHWDFSKQHFFKWFHENYKILECSSR